MLLPALKNAKDQAKAISCLSNLKQVGLAQLSYLNENKETFTGNVGLGGTDRWYDLLLVDDYIPLNSYCTGSWRSSPSGLYWGGPTNVNNILFCPSLEVPPNSGRSGGFAWNTLYGGVSNIMYVDGQNLKRITNPSSRIMFLDGKVYSGAYNPSFCFKMDNITNSDYQDWRHSRGINAVFIDGHAEYIKMTNITAQMLSQ